VSRKVRLFLVVIVSVVALDQGSKVAVRHSLAPTEAVKATYKTTFRRGLDPWCQLSTRQIRVIDGYFDICYSENTGVAFGLGKKVPRWVWVGVGLLALGLILTFLRQAREGQTRMVLALALVGGGAVGNIIDRAIFGHVTDFVVWRWQEHTWPTFNVADAALVVGVFLMFFAMRRGDAADDAKDEAGAAEAPARTGKRKGR
jgi:signal peptidase II